MSPSARKRFDAFEDFSEGESAQKISPLPGKVSPQSASQVERIERLKPSQMIPDRFQPRRLLPSSIRSAFYSGKIDCYQAAEQWLALGKQERSYQAEIERLLSMGNSFEDHGQIKPITGSWTPASGGNFIFVIETGERRFWAACLRKVSEGKKDEPLLRIEAVEKPTRQRQVLENRHAEAPSSVGQACEIASLILAELNIQPENGSQDEFEFFRLARSQRMPAGLWDKITPIMQLSRPRMVQLLNILQFSTNLLELADRYRLPERVLREVLALPHEQWDRMLRLSIQNSLTSDDVVELTSQPVAQTQENKRPSPSVPQPQKVALSGLRRFANALGELDEISQAQALDEIADDIIVANQAGAEGICSLLEELAGLIRVRLSR